MPLVSTVESPGKARKRLREVIVEKFPNASDLELIVDECFSKNLSQIAEGNNYVYIVHELVSWLGRDPCGRLRPFLEAAKEANPGAADDLESAAAGLVQPVSDTGGSLQERVQRFLAELEARSDLFAYLNAYKELHELVHNLHASQPRLSAAFASRAADPNLPLSDDLVNSFADWKEVGSRCAREVEFSERLLPWIPNMASALDCLSSPNAKQWPWAMERLRSIPISEMRPLNDKIIECACRLRCEQLIEYLDAILKKLASGAADPDVTSLAGRITYFRDLCTELVKFVRMHELCQRINDLLNATPTLPTITAESLMTWPEISRLVDELVELCPEDFRAARVQKAAQGFASAAEIATAQSQYVALMERFADLFLETDKRLLDVSRRIPGKGLGLANDLRKLS